MSIKNLFNSLKKIGKKKYYNRNGEEELLFIGKSLEIQIYNTYSYMDIVINNQSYLDSPFLTNSIKLQIQSILNSYFSLDIKCKSIAGALLNDLTVFI